MSRSRTPVIDYARPRPPPLSRAHRRRAVEPRNDHPPGA